MAEYKAINAFLKNKDGEWISPYTADTLKKNQITNCITEIPQRIKVELVDGSVVLKAGSVVTVPNGFEADGTTPKFDYVTVESDRDIVNSSATVAQRMCWIELPNGYANGTTQFCFSGNTSVMNSTTPYTYSTFYNTETNKMYRGNGTAWVERPFSLPVCLATNDATTKFTSIDQVFNGFGYIGQCTFVDKGVKALIADGRNEDGTLKNKETVSNKVTVRDLNGENSILGFFDGETLYGFGINAYIVKDDIPTVTTTNALWYSPRDNYHYFTSDGGATWTKRSRFCIGNLYKADATSNITSMDIKQPFRAVDYNEALREVGSGKSANGYCKLSNGLIVQWGDLTLTSGQTATVTLPTPYSSTNYMALLSMYQNGAADSSKNWQSKNLTTTTFQAQNGQGGTCRYGWLAIGF